VAFNTQPYLALRLKKGQTSIPPLGRRGLLQGDLYLRTPFGKNEEMKFELRVTYT